MQPFRLTYGLGGLVGEIAPGLGNSPDFLHLPDGRLVAIAYNGYFGGGMKAYREHHRAEDGSPIFEGPLPVRGVVGCTRTLDLDGDGVAETLALQRDGLFLYRPGLAPAARAGYSVGRAHPLCGVDGQPLPLPEHAHQIEALVEGGTFHLVIGTNDWSRYWPGGKSPWAGEECDVGLGRSYTPAGEWRGGPLQGRLLFYRNVGTAREPRFQPPVPLRAGGKEVCVYGHAAPAALPGRYGLDLVVGDFMDRLILLRRQPGEGVPQFQKPVGVCLPSGGPLVYRQNMINPRSVDWFARGKPVDLVAGAEDGRFWVSRPVCRDGAIRYQRPVPALQVDPPLSCGVLAVPAVCDWFGHGLPDLVVGNAGGFVEVFENVGSPGAPRYLPPRPLHAGGSLLRVQAGPTGSIQGPSEAKWGYTCPTVYDWDGDGLLDLLTGDITGYQTLYRNIGAPGRPRLAAGVRLHLEGVPLQTVWRVRPCALDWDGDGRPEYLCLDRQGRLMLLRRHPTDIYSLVDPMLLPGPDGGPIRLDGPAGHEGRAKLAVCDWDGDGDWDVFVGLHRDEPLAAGAGGATVVYLENVGTNARPRFAPPRQVRLQDGRPLSFGCHCCAPEPVALFGEEQPGLLIGTEDGGLYYHPRDSLTI